MKRVAATSMLAALVLIQSCGASSFATEIRVILAASGPLIESLNLGERKAPVIIGLTELSGDAATLADSLKTCGTDKPCKLDAVSKFQSDFDRISARGVFGVHPKLERVSQILSGIIASAKIYYGGRQPRVAGVPGAAPQVVTERDIDAQVKELKAAMRP